MDRIRWCRDCRYRNKGGERCDRCEKDWTRFNRASGYKEAGHDRENKMVQR